MYTAAREEKKRFIPSAKVIGSLQCFILRNDRGMVMDYSGVSCRMGTLLYYQILSVLYIYLVNCQHWIGTRYKCDTHLLGYLLWLQQILLF